MSPDTCTFAPASLGLTRSAVNEYRTARVAEVLEDFRVVQYYIAAVPSEPENPEDYYLDGYAVLRQCAIDGQHILNCAADTSVPSASSEEEQMKAELKQWVVFLSFPARGGLVAGERAQRIQTNSDPQGLPRRVRPTSRSPEDISPAGRRAEVDRVPSPGASGGPAVLGEPPPASRM